MGMSTNNSINGNYGYGSGITGTTTGIFTTTSPYTYDSYVTSTKQVLRVDQYMNIEYVVDIKGVVIPFSEIKAVSLRQFDDPSGMMSQLASDLTFNDGYSVYVKDLEDEVHIVDLSSNYNRDNFEYVSSYDSSIKMKVFLYQFSQRKNSKKSEKVLDSDT
jgi:hypothetical protein